MPRPRRCGVVGPRGNRLGFGVIPNARRPPPWSGPALRETARRWVGANAHGAHKIAYVNLVFRVGDVAGSGQERLAEHLRGREYSHACPDLQRIRLL